MKDEILAQCRDALPGWEHLTVDDVRFDAPKGFSSFTMTLRATKPADPPAIFYRRLEGKENAILPTAMEREAEITRLVQETRDLIPLSHYMYAMAAIPLAVEPIQKIRFLPYAHMRFERFLASYRERFGDA